jgi:hypothetical protein
VPTTFRTHFDNDITRAENILARSLAMQGGGEPERLYKDIRLSSIALAVGALDAYLCDAYVDCLTAVLRAYSQGQWVGALPSTYSKQMLPAGEILKSTRLHRPQWRIRMAARKVIEKDNMLSLSRFEDCFNGILPNNRKLWLDFVPVLAAHNLVRLTRHVAADLAPLAGDALIQAKKEVASAVTKRLGSTIQLRHDWIHNCGRPRNAIQDLTHGQASARVRDIRLFIEDLDNHLDSHRVV